MSSLDRKDYKYIQVELQPGLFNNELTVVIVVGGKSFQSVVPRDYVRVENEPQPSRAGKGLLQVRVVESAGKGTAWVDMPQASFTSQPRILVEEQELVAS